jgi:hypothetical protein
MEKFTPLLQGGPSARSARVLHEKWDFCTCEEEEEEEITLKAWL